MSNAETEKKETRAAKVNRDIGALLRSRHTVLWIVTREEKRVEDALVETAGKAGFKTRFWDCASGLRDPEGVIITQDGNPETVLKMIEASTTATNTKERFVTVLRDLHKWLDPMITRRVVNLARSLQGLERAKAGAIVILTSSSEVPPELAGHVTVIEYPIPDRMEVEKILTAILEAIPDDVRANVLDSPETRELAIDAAVGLTAAEASNCYAKSLVTVKKIDPSVVSSEKKRIIAREKVLTWHDPDPRGLDAIGGLEHLKEWLRVRRKAFAPQARAFGVPTPKGILLAGIPGTGKSLTAKCISTAWQMPLLRLDLGALKSKWIGESEANIRKALQVAQAVAPCVLWLDEIEKALGGSTSPQGDGGVAADALGAILSWMQDREGAVFVVATANDISGLPPELLRKGRFDDVFFLDLPTKSERKQIIEATMMKYANTPFESPLDTSRIADAVDGFTGAEIAELFPEALFRAFEENSRKVTTEDLIIASKSVVPLKETAKEKIEDLRKWGETRARRASKKEEVRKAARSLDMD